MPSVLSKNIQIKPKSIIIVSRVHENNLVYLFLEFTVQRKIAERYLHKLSQLFTL